MYIINSISYLGIYIYWFIIKIYFTNHKNNPISKHYMFRGPKLYNNIMIGNILKNNSINNINMLKKAL